jgi:HNH endonuclease
MSQLLKRCTQCRETFPATPEFFNRNKMHKDGLLAECKACKKKRDAVYRSRPGVREYHQAYSETYYSHPEIKERVRSWHQAYYCRPEIQERERARRRVYYTLPETKKYYQERDRRPKRQAQHQVNERTRRARKRNVSGTHTPQQIQNLLKRQRFCCYYCSSKFEQAKGKYIYHVDHTFPLSRVAGTNIPANDVNYLVLTCPTCNLKKQDKFPWEWHEGGKLL